MPDEGWGRELLSLHPVLKPNAWRDEEEAPTAKDPRGRRREGAGGGGGFPTVQLQSSKDAVCIEVATVQHSNV